MVWFTCTSWSNEFTFPVFWGPKSYTQEICFFFTSSLEKKVTFGLNWSLLTLTAEGKIKKDFNSSFSKLNATDLCRLSFLTISYFGLSKKKKLKKKRKKMDNLRFWVALVADMFLMILV